MSKILTTVRRDDNLIGTRITVLHCEGETSDRVFIKISGRQFDLDYNEFVEFAEAIKELPPGPGIRHRDVNL